IFVLRKPAYIRLINRRFAARSAVSALDNAPALKHVRRLQARLIGPIEHDRAAAPDANLESTDTAV
ncbi:hypothetical protein, partial [Massilia yuzhufengensis]|uniref:hypothetical protein n=2 Tax=Massilia yuzhufengensis TaxID=1164594 RepID=UPI001C434953